MSKTCCIFNYAPHYRKSIFQLMDQELKCDFYFGGSVFSSLVKLDYKLLDGYIRELRTVKFFDFKWQFGISRTFKAKYDSYIITGDPSYLSNWLVLFYCIVARKKVYMWCHGLKETNSRFGMIQSKLFFGNSTGGLLLYGNYARDLMIREGYSSEKLHVIYNSLDYEMQLGIRKKSLPSKIYSEKFGNEDPVLLFIGRLTKAKKIKMIIEAQKRLLDQGVNTNVVLIGEGEDGSYLAQLVDNYELNRRVWFYGSCYEETEIASLVRNASITVSPGNVGLTAIHSMMYGTPVITHGNFENQMPEYESVVPGRTGDLFEENNLQNLVEQIAKYLNQVETKRQVFRKECYKMVDNYYNPDFQITLLKKLLR